MLAQAGCREGPSGRVPALSASAESSRTYFHCCPAGTDPESLLDPEAQFTEPWGSSDHGPCGKCAGALLVHPERIAEARPLDAETVAAVRARIEQGDRG